MSFKDWRFKHDDPFLRLCALYTLQTCDLVYSLTHLKILPVEESNWRSQCLNGCNHPLSRSVSSCIRERDGSKFKYAAILHINKAIFMSAFLTLAHLHLPRPQCSETPHSSLGPLELPAFLFAVFPLWLLQSSNLQCHAQSHWPPLRSSQKPKSREKISILQYATISACL